jgi:hypothetical protein
VIVLVPERVVFEVCKRPNNGSNSTEDFGQLFVDCSPSSVRAFLLFGSRHAVGWLTALRFLCLIRRSLTVSLVC